MAGENGSAMTQSESIGGSAEDRRRRDHRRLSPPDKSYDVVAWRHHIIKEMETAGFGPSFISAVLRQDHTTVIYHMKGKCRCDVSHISAPLPTRTELSTGVE